MSETTKIVSAPREIVLTPVQCRMARGALRWTVEALAQQARLAKNTVMAFESGKSVRDSSAADIQAVLERQGIRFSRRGAHGAVTLTRKFKCP